MLLNGPFWSSRPRTSSHGTALGGGETLPFMQMVPWVCRQRLRCSPPPIEIGCCRFRSLYWVAETRVYAVSAGDGSGVGVGRYGISVPHVTTPHPNPPPQGGREQ